MTGYAHSNTGGSVNSEDSVWQMKMGLAASNHSNIIPAQSINDLQPTYGGGPNVNYDMHTVGGHHYSHNGGGGLPMGHDDGGGGGGGGSYAYNHPASAAHLAGDDYNNYNNTLRSSHSARQEQYCADPYASNGGGQVHHQGHQVHMDQQLGECEILFFLYVNDVVDQKSIYSNGV